MAVKKPSTEQIFVLRKLAIRRNAGASGKIAYYKGGFWSWPGQIIDEKVIDGVPKDWHTSRQTVDAMERRGWLRRMDTGTNYDPKKFPGLEDRQITDEGIAVVADVREEPIRLDPDDGLVHVRKHPSDASAKAALCGRTGACSVSSAWGFWGPGGAGFPQVCPKCYEAESGRPKAV